MGFLSNSASFSRFSVNESDVLPENYRNDYAISIKRFSFRELDEDSSEVESVGWVNISDQMDVDFKDGEFFKGEFITLSIRTDTRQVPAQALKNQLRKVIKEKMAAGEPPLSKDLKNELREAIKEQFIKRAIPRTKINDVVWNTKTGEVLFSSLSEKSCLQFLTIFKETFGINLSQLFPYSLAQKLIPIDQQSSLEKLNPAIFSLLRTTCVIPEASDIVNLIDSKKFIGQEFLTWLWYCSQVNEGKVASNKKLELWIDDNIVLESIKDEEKAEKVICCHGEMHEGREAISQGKKVTNARYKLYLGDDEYSFTLDGTWLNFKTCRTPKVVFDKDDIDGTFFEKIYLLQVVIKAIDTLFAEFITLRMSNVWIDSVKEIINWINK